MLCYQKIFVPTAQYLKCIITPPGDGQNRKFALILIITEAKKAHSFACKQTRFVNQMFGDFVKMALTRVSSH